MSVVKITLPDGSSRDYPLGVKGIEVAQSISEGLARNALSIEVNGEIWDLSRAINTDASIKIFTWNDKGGKYAFWHSSAHLFAEALEAEANHFTNEQGRAGQLQNRFETELVRLEERSNLLTKEIGDQADADLAQVSIQISTLMVQYEAAAKTFADLSRLSLLDYL